MMDTPETLKAALADLSARVVAFEKARVEEEEPPVCSEALLAFLERGCESLGGSDYQKAAAEIRYLRRELARLREGLAEVPLDEGRWNDKVIALCCNLDKEGLGRDPLINGIANWSLVRVMAREIQRHRALLKDGGGK